MTKATGPVILGRDDILNASDVVTEQVDVPEWGGAVLVRGMTGKQRDAFEASVLEGKGASQSVNLANLRSKLVARCVVDSDGKRLFTDADIGALGGKSAAALQRVFVVAQRLSGIGDTAVEELTISLGEDQSDGSGSD